MSAYANIARAWGAEVRGWDVGETIFTETLDGVELDLGGEPRPPDGFEVVVSTGHRERIDGNLARSFLAELVDARDRDRRHRRARQDDDDRDDRLRAARDRARPAWIVGGVIPQLGGNAGGGAGWLVVEGDESDRSVFDAAAADRGRHERRARPSRRVWLRGRAADTFDAGSRACRRSFAAGSSSPSSSRSRCPASTTAGTPLRPSPRSSRLASSRARPQAALGSLHRRRPALRGRRRAGWRRRRSTTTGTTRPSSRGARDGRERATGRLSPSTCPMSWSERGTSTASSARRSDWRTSRS